MKLSEIAGKILSEMAKNKLPDGGDCFDSAFDFMTNNMRSKDYENLKLVHNFVSGQGSLSGYRYTHAWVEDDNYVYDYSNGKTNRIPKILYYGIGNIYEEDGKYYGKDEVIEMMLKYQTKGPWEIQNKHYKEKWDPITRRYK